MDFNAAGTCGGDAQLHHRRQRRHGDALSSIAVDVATNLTVSVDGAAATNHTVADTDAVSEAEIVQHSERRI